MYDLNLLRRDYGVIRKYEKPKDRFVGSIMNLSNTGGKSRESMIAKDNIISNL